MYNLRANSKKKNDKNNAVMYAAALQDHFMKKNNYNILDMKTNSNKNIKSGITQTKNLAQKLPSIKK